jgi:hypothetical protein
LIDRHLVENPGVVAVQRLAGEIGRVAWIERPGLVLAVPPTANPPCPWMISGSRVLIATSPSGTRRR